MSDSDGYNGWKNYETWNVALWIDNDEGSYNWSREMARDAVDQSELEPYGPAVILADMLKDWIESSAPPMEASTYSDLLNAALSDVDWHEIAESFLSDIAEEAR